MGRRIPVKKLHNKRDRFTKDYKAFKNLQNHSGLGWDPVNCRFDYNESEWECSSNMDLYLFVHLLYFVHLFFFFFDVYFFNAEKP